MRKPILVAYATKHAYGAIVLGGALYTGRWHRDARRFLARHRSELANLPIAVFAMGPLEMTPTGVADSRRQVDRALAKEHDLEPVAVTVFGGVVDPAKLHFPFTHMDATDARDWQAIRAWADELVDVFATPAAA